MSTRPSRPRLLGRLLVSIGAFLVLVPTALGASSGLSSNSSTAAQAAGFGGATATAPGVPRYQILGAPDGSGANGSSGEFNIGYNPRTGAILTNSSASVWKVTLPEK